MKKIGLSPLRNFGVVDADRNIYRSAQPMYGYEYDWIRNRLGVDTIVNLRAESRHDSAMSKGFDVVNIDVKDHHPPTLDQAREFIDLISNGKNILFHCEHGHGRTSTFCVLAGVALGMDIDAALEREENEYCCHFKHPEQLDWLKKNFKKDLVVS